MVYVTYPIIRTGIGFLLAFNNYKEFYVYEIINLLIKLIDKW